MSIKIFNPETEQWERQSTMMATSVKVMDVDGHYEEVENKTVENCLTSIQETISDLKDDVKYIYENGTLGGGNGGGGGSVMPTVTIKKPEGGKISVNSKQQVTITYSWTSPNRGGGTVTLTDYDGTTRSINAAPNTDYTWKVGPFPRKESAYILFISVVDSQGMGSIPEMIEVTSGAVDLTSTFVDGSEFLINEDVIVPIDIKAPAGEPLLLKCTFRGEPHRTLNNMPIEYGPRELNFGPLGVKGPSRATFQVVTVNESAEGVPRFESETLAFNMIVTDSENLTMYSSFDQNFVWSAEDNLNIDYVLSKKGEYAYKTKRYINDMTTPVIGNSDITDDPSPTKNYWRLGTSLEVREEPHHLRIVSTTLDGSVSAQLDFYVTVTSDGFKPLQPVTGAKVIFSANGKTNGDKWYSEDEQMFCELKGFSFAQRENGDFVDGFTGKGTLKFDGKAYAIMDYAPFKNGLPASGFTFEIVYKCKNTGDIDGKVASLFDKTNDKGFDINTQQAMFKVSGGTAASFYEEDTIVTQTIVIDPTYKVTPLNEEYEKNPTVNQWLPAEPNGVIKIYTDGVISSVEYFNTKAAGFRDMFKFDGKIILGAAADTFAGNQNLNKITNFGTCEIKTIRIYEKYLSDEQVLSNYIASQDQNKQKSLIKINEMDPSVAYTGLPIVRILDEVRNIGADIPKNTEVTYTDALDVSLSINNVTAEVSWQGTSSKTYPVKNYTVQLKEEGGVLPKVDWTPNKNWLGEYRWTIKANYMDSSQANNIGVAKFIEHFFKNFCDHRYPQYLINSKTRSTIDGVPIRLYIGREGTGDIDDFAGLATWNIDRYAKHNLGLSTFRQVKDESTGKVTGVEINNHKNAVSYEFQGNNTLSSRFMTKDFNQIRTEVKHRYNYRETDEIKVTEKITDKNGSQIEVLRKAREDDNGSMYHEELMTLMTFMHDCDQEKFDNEIHEYFSVPHLIDYYLICQMFGLVDSLGKNMVLTTFGKERDDQDIYRTIWYPSFYDMDTCLGLNNQGQQDVSSGVMTDEYANQESKLWDMLTKSPKYSDSIRTRYLELITPKNGKAAPFSYDHIISFLEREVINNIGQKYYNQDADYKYISKKMYKYMCLGNRLSAMKRWLRNRTYFMETLYESTAYEENALAMRSNKPYKGKFVIKTYYPALIKFSPGDGSLPIKIRCDSKGTEMSYEIINKENNNIAFYGADHIMEIKGLEDGLNLSFISIEKAKKINNLEVIGNKRLTEIVFGKNTYLRKLNVNGCSGLGSLTTNSKISLLDCTNIRDIDVSNTSLAGLDLPEGGYIERIDIRNTKISSLTIKDQIYLSEADATNKTGLLIDAATIQRLNTFTLQGCHNFTKLELADSQSSLQKVNITNCKNLVSANFSGTRSLNSITSVLCPKLTKLVLKNVNGQGVRELDLTTLTELTELDISGSYVEFLKFGQYTPEGGTLTNFDKLTKFYANDSNIRAFGFGVDAKYNPETAVLDFTSFNKNDVSTIKDMRLYKCSQLTDIKGLNYVGNLSFRENTRLRTIKGKLVLSGAVDNLFYHCSGMEEYPAFDLTRVTAFNSTFWGAKINMTQLQTIIRGLNGSIFTQFSHTFRGCTGLNGQLPDDLFDGFTELRVIEAMFWGCSNINGALKQTKLKLCKKITNAYRSFRDTGLTETPTNLDFALWERIENMGEMFYNTKLKTPPESSLFLGQRKFDASTLRSVYGMFQYCSEMRGTLPHDLFKQIPSLVDMGYTFYNTKVTGNLEEFGSYFDTNSGSANRLESIEGHFAGTQISGKIPNRLLTLCTSLTRINRLFYNLPKVTGKIPDNFLSENNFIQEMEYLFNGTSLGTNLAQGETLTIRPSLFKGKKELRRISGMFKGLSKLAGSIPEGLFDDCTKLTHVDYLFDGCSTLSGHIPYRDSVFGDKVWVPKPGYEEFGPDKNPNFDEEEHKDFGSWVKPEKEVKKYGIFDKAVALQEVRNLFSGCINLTGSIPKTLLMGGSAVTDASNLFNNCWKLTGGIPKELFSYCPKLTTVQGCFSVCRSLRNEEVYNPNAPENERHTYALPPELFHNNPELLNVHALCYMWSEEKGVPPTLFGGEMPPDLFEKNTKLSDAGAAFTGTGITGTLTANTFNKCINLNTVADMFYGSSLERLEEDLFSTCQQAINFSNAFRSLGNAKGNTFDVTQVNTSSRANCFKDSNFDNINDPLLSTWK